MTPVASTNEETEPESTRIHSDHKTSVSDNYSDVKSVDQLLESVKVFFVLYVFRILLDGNVFVFKWLLHSSAGDYGFRLILSLLHACTGFGNS